MASTNTPELKVILCGEYGVGKVKKKINYVKLCLLIIHNFHL